MIDLFELISVNVEWIKTQFSVIITFASLFMYFKLRFFDAGFYNKLQKLYGKQRLIDALEIVLQLLKSYDPSALIQKIKSMDNIEAKMNEALLELQNVLNPIPPKEIPLKLSRHEEKQLTEKIRLLATLIGKELEIHEIQKERFVDKLIKDTKQKTKLEAIDKEIKANGKEKVLALTTPK